MKNLKFMFTIFFATILAILLYPTNSVSANDGFEDSWNYFEDNVPYCYDLNYDGTVNILDLIIAENNLLGESPEKSCSDMLGNLNLTLKDLLNIRYYLSTGQTLRMSVQVYDINQFPATSENISLLKNIMNTYCFKRHYKNGQVFLYYINNSVIHEIRFTKFIDGQQVVSNLCTVDPLTGLTFYFGDLAIIDGHFTLQSYSFSIHSVDISNEINLERILSVKNNSEGTKSTIISDGGEHPILSTLNNTKTISKVEKVYRLDNEQIVFGIDSETGLLSVYNGKFTFTDLTYTTVTQESFRGIPLNFNSTSGDLFLKTDDNVIIDFHLNHWNHSDEIINVYEVDGYLLCLGIKDGMYVWDNEFSTYPFNQMHIWSSIDTTEITEELPAVG